MNTRRVKRSDLHADDDISIAEEILYSDSDEDYEEQHDEDYEEHCTENYYEDDVQCTVCTNNKDDGKIQRSLIIVAFLVYIIITVLGIYFETDSTI